MGKLSVTAIALATLVAGPLVTAPAAAADLKPVYKAKPPVVVYDWTGCHVGRHFGAAWIRDRDTETGTGTGIVTPFSPIDNSHPNGVKLGGYLGCDYQFAGGFVIGVEGDAESAYFRGGQA